MPRIVPRGAGLQRLQVTRESPTKAPPAAQALKRAAPRAAEASRAGAERPTLEASVTKSVTSAVTKCDGSCVETIRALRERLAKLEGRAAPAKRNRAEYMRGYRQQKK